MWYRFNGGGDRVKTKLFFFSYRGSLQISGPFKVEKRDSREVLAELQKYDPNITKRSKFPICDCV